MQEENVVSGYESVDEGMTLSQKDIDSLTNDDIYRIINSRVLIIIEGEDAVMYPDFTYMDEEDIDMEDEYAYEEYKDAIRQNKIIVSIRDY